MHLLLAILTFAILIGVSLLSEFLKKRTFSKAAFEAAVLPDHSISEGMTASPPTIAVLPSGEDGRRVEGYILPESLYYHQGHSWVAPQGEETALVGMDEFACKLIGRPTSIVVPKVGETFRQGEKGWMVKQGNKAANMVFPLDGKVVAVNEAALRHPELMTSEPYGRGWLFMVKTRSLRWNVRNLLRGAVARRWMEESAAELRALFDGKIGYVFQDGGLPEEGVADRLGAAQWRELARRVFLVEPKD
jgi:glycine cleavage system H lipoate-binding protein